MKLIRTLNVFVILTSIAIIVVMSIDVLTPEAISSQAEIVDFHFVVSMVFIVDFFVRMTSANRWWVYLMTNSIFFLVSLPLLSFSIWFEWDIDKSTELIIRYIPFLRAIYGFVIVFRYITKSRITNLFYTYIVLVVATTYFCSLLFFTAEYGINSGVKSFGDAIWWALMDMTTVGSDIIAQTTVGRVISVVLAAGGMMLFPIFTVYITKVFDRNDEVD